MITKLSYPLKVHIEQHIDEIEQNYIYNSVVSCPWSILNEYIEVLKAIDLPVDFEEPMIKLFQFLSTMFPEGYCIDVCYSDASVTTYEFQFPLQNVNYQKLKRMITDACPNCLLVAAEHRYTSRLTTIQVKVFNGQQQ